jgi:hypothetical protein
LHAGRLVGAVLLYNLFSMLTVMHMCLACPAQGLHAALHKGFTQPMHKGAFPQVPWLQGDVLLLCLVVAFEIDIDEHTAGGA